jgi:ParB family chromosome partitioning protein
MWSELEGWTALYDVLELAAALKDDDWARFERVVTETIELRDRLREARTAAASA